MNSNTGGLDFLATDLTVSLNQKLDTSLIQKRMLTSSEIELLQKDKRESFNKMNEILGDSFQKAYKKT